MQKNYNYVYFLFSILFIIVSTNYLSLEDIINSANQTDVISYSEIAKIAPELPKDSKIIIQHVAQRFLIHYIVGSIADFTNVNFFVIYKIINFIFVLLYIYLIVFLSKCGRFFICKGIFLTKLLSFPNIISGICL